MNSVSSVVNSAEFGIDEAAAEKTQRVPIHAADEMARKVGLEKGAGVVRVREGRLDQLVVGLVKRTLWLGHERECCKQPSWRQRKEYDGFDKLPVRDARGRFGKIMDSKIIFLGGDGRAAARGVFRMSVLLPSAGCLATGTSWRMALMSRGLLFSNLRRGLADSTGAVLRPAKNGRLGGRLSRVDAPLRVFTPRAGCLCCGMWRRLAESRGCRSRRNLRWLGARGSSA